MRLLWPLCGLMAVLTAWFVQWMDVTVYQIKTAIHSIQELLTMPREEINKALAAYEYFQNVGISNQTGNQEEEADNVRAYYRVLQHIFVVADIEKMYIPPQIDVKRGNFQNQLILEEKLFDTLQVANKSDVRLLDIGCGRGRIAANAVKHLPNAKVSGFNIDKTQVASAIEYAKASGLSDRLDFKVGDHHKRFEYPDQSFDGAYTVQALWPFITVKDLDGRARELFRVLKPGARYTCQEFLLTPHFNWKDPKHVEMHRLFLPTLAGTQANYPKDVTDALERAGFKLILSAPSDAPAWPITDARTDMFLLMRAIIKPMVRVGLLQPWAEKLVDNLLLGGQAYTAAEKAKLIDLNWQIIAERPL